MDMFKQVYRQSSSIQHRHFANLGGLPCSPNLFPPKGFYIGEAQSLDTTREKLSGAQHK